MEINITNLRKNTIEMLNTISNDDIVFLSTLLSSNYSFNNSLNVIYILTRMTLLTDYYILIKNCSTMLDNSYLEQFNNAKHAILNNNKSIFKDPNILKKMITSVSIFINDTTYHKITYYKSLPNDDLLMLKKFNPFFEDEYNLYNINIDKNFILKNIKEWDESRGINVALESVSHFICDIYKIDPDMIIELLADIIEELDLDYSFINTIENRNIYKIKLIIYQYYLNNYNNTLKKK